MSSVSVPGQRRNSCITTSGVFRCCCSFVILSSRLTRKVGRGGSSSVLFKLKLKINLVLPGFISPSCKENSIEGCFEHWGLNRIYRLCSHIKQSGCQLNMWHVTRLHTRSCWSLLISWFLLILLSISEMGGATLTQQSWSLETQPVFSVNMFSQNKPSVAQWAIICKIQIEICARPRTPASWPLETYVIVWRISVPLLLDGKAQEQCIELWRRVGDLFN